MFYILIFGLLAVVLVVVAVTTQARRRRQLDVETRGGARTSQSTRNKRKAERAQSQHDRRKRH